MKCLRASVIKSGEWFKERDMDLWRATRQRVLQRDHYTCTYCRLQCHKFMQVNHIGAEDNHELDNLETVCPACHSVMHLGINVMEGRMLSSIPEGGFRGYLPEGKAIMFHEAEPWKGYPESVWRWQCLPESRYRKD